MNLPQVQSRDGSTQRITLRSHPSYRFWTAVSTDFQVLVGMPSTFMVAARFSLDGRFVETVEWELSERLECGSQKQMFERLPQLVDMEVERFHSSFRVSEREIVIQEFSVPRLAISCSSQPPSWAEFCANPVDFDDDDIANMESVLVEWRRERMCVLNWGQSLFLDGNGNVTSS